MADKQEKKAEAQEIAVVEERVEVVLNPDTNLGGYAFDAEFSAVPGQRYALTQEQYERYRKVKHNDSQVIIKA